MVAHVRVNRSELRHIERKLKGIKSGVPKAMSRGINKTATAAKTEVKQGIFDEVKVKKSAINKGLRLIKATYKRWAATIEVTGKRLALGYFAARQLKKSVSYQISKKEARQKIDYDKDTSRVFVNTLGTGHKGIFARVQQSRLPIVELYGPSLPRIFNGASGLADRIVKKTSKNLNKNINTQAKLLVAKANK